MIGAFNGGASGSPWGGMRAIDASRMSSTPRPVFADADGLGGVDADHILDFLAHAVGVGRGQVDLVQHRHHLDAELRSRV